MARPAKFSLEAEPLADYFSPGNANTAETVTMFADVVPIDANLSCLIDGEVHGSYAIIEGGRELVFRRKTALPLQSGC